MKSGPLAVGTLVLVTRGPDLAGRLKRLDLKRTLAEGERDFARLTIAVGKAAHDAALGMFATMDEIEVQSYATLRIALDGVAEQIDALGRSFYVVSACSLSRAGAHTLKIEARRNVTTAEGKNKKQSGTLRHKFDATGFGGGCDPSLPTNWRAGGAQSPGAQSQPPETEADAPEGDDDSSDAPTPPPDAEPDGYRAPDPE